MANYVSKYPDGAAVDEALDKGKTAYERTEKMYTKSEVDALIAELTNRIAALEAAAPETEV